MRNIMQPTRLYNYSIGLIVINLVLVKLQNLNLFIQKLISASGCPLYVHT